MKNKLYFRDRFLKGKYTSEFSFYVLVQGFWEITDFNYTKW